MIDNRIESLTLHASRVTIAKWLGLVAMLLVSSPVAGQSNGQQDIDRAKGDTVQLATQGEIPLSDFVDYISRRVGVPIVYDQSIRSKKVNLVAPEPIPIRSLMEVLQNVLLNEGLVLSDGELKGWKRITTNARIPEVARPSRTDEDLNGAGAAVPLTRIFILKNTTPQKAVELITPFLTKPGASVVPLDSQSMILVTDVAENIRRAAELIEIVDGGRPLIDTRFIPAKSILAKDLATQLQDIYAARHRAAGQVDGDASKLEITVDERLNRIVLIGTSNELERAEELLKLLDTKLPTTQRTFSVEFISPEKLDEVMRGILDGRAVKPPYQARVEGDVLIAESTDEVLMLLDSIRAEMDTREAPESQSPIRFYRIKNVPAQELVGTLQNISGQSNTIGQRRSLPVSRRTSNDSVVPGPNYGPFGVPGLAQPQRTPPLPPAFQDQAQDANLNNPLLQQNLDQGLGRDGAGLNEINLRRMEAETGAFASAEPRSDASKLLGRAEVTVDVHTNTIIVVAAPEVQRIYASLIKTLDERRPQVLVEAKVVVIDTSDNYTLGVEVSGGDRSGVSRLFAFSSFGLSNVDPVTGALQVIPGAGFNGTLVDPSTADLVVKALANHRRARVLSTPKILVNDNAEGQLTSVAEVPFTSVNASQTVATTSFAGFAEAGTTITVTPTISDDNYLQIDYIITLNSFTGAGAAGVPPPRQTNELKSRVTVPDGHTIIVGGLKSSNTSYETTGIPFLENIPVLRELASLQSDNWDETSLFVFLRPVILREDQFKDLKYFSAAEMQKACLPAHYPTSKPLTMR